MDDRVIHDVLDVLGKPQGTYAESFVALSLFLADIYKFVVLVEKHDRHQTSDIQTYIQTDTGEI